MRVVVKIGGRALDSNLERIVESIARHSRSHELFIVHGGGDKVTRYSLKMGVEPRFVVSPSGVRSRYTSLEELEVYVMVMAGKINKEIVAKLYEKGVKAVGLTGADGELLVAERKKRIIIVDERGRKRVIEGGYTGRIIRVNKSLIEKLAEMGYTIVIAPIAVSVEGELLNVDGDQAACSVAGALKSDYLVMLTDVEGLILNGELIRKLRVNEVDDAASKAGFGMNRKLLMIKKALEEGVGKAVIASGLTRDPVGEALAGKGTVIGD